VNGAPIAIERPRPGPLTTSSRKAKAAPPGGGTWFDAALNATAEKVITIFCLGIAPNIFGINTEKILCLSG
tara:strand:- start:119 stop:331 length:213 start_codon:yes stop_codon:yes gene_type:complete